MKKVTALLLGTALTILPSGLFAQEKGGIVNVATIGEPPTLAAHHATHCKRNASGRGDEVLSANSLLYGRLLFTGAAAAARRHRVHA